MIIDCSKEKVGNIEKVDICIVGSGAGGAPFAYYISEKGLNVVVLESGPYISEDEKKDSPFNLVLKTYRYGGITASIGTPAIALPRGEVLGGTTLINSGTCFAPPEKILDLWSKEFNIHWVKSDRFNETIKEIEDKINVSVVDPLIIGKNSQLIFKGANELGINVKLLKRNVKDCEGKGLCCYGCPTGAKMSMDRTFIPDAQKNGVRFFTRCKAKYIIVKNNKVQGLIAKTINGEVLIKTSIVVLAAGAIETPYLLKKSSIKIKGPLGKNLSIHPATKVFALFKEEVNPVEGIPQSTYIDDFINEGIIMEGMAVLPDIAAMSIPYYGKPHSEIMKKYRFLASYGVMVKDKGYGVIRKGLGDHGVAFYRMDKEDAKKLAIGIKKICEIFFAAGAQRVFPSIRFLQDLKSMKELSKFNPSGIKPTDLEMMAFHPLGTCRMGEEPSKTVVNTNFEVHGIRGLFVTDASVLPTSLGVNPQETIIAFSAMAGKMLKENYL